MGNKKLSKKISSRLRRDHISIFTFFHSSGGLGALEAARKPKAARATPRRDEAKPIVQGLPGGRVGWNCNDCYALPAAEGRECYALPAARWDGSATPNGRRRDGNVTPYRQQGGMGLIRPTGGGGMGMLRPTGGRVGWDSQVLSDKKE